MAIENRGQLDFSSQELGSLPPKQTAEETILDTKRSDDWEGESGVPATRGYGIPEISYDMGTSTDSEAHHHQVQGTSAPEKTIDPDVDDGNSREDRVESSGKLAMDPTANIDHWDNEVIPPVVNDHSPTQNCAPSIDEQILQLVSPSYTNSTSDGSRQSRPGGRAQSVAGKIVPNEPANSDTPCEQRRFPQTSQLRLPSANSDAAASSTDSDAEEPLSRRRDRARTSRSAPINPPPAAAKSPSPAPKRIRKRKVPATPPLDPPKRAKRTARNGKEPKRRGGFKRYECRWPDCGKTFATAGHLSRHTRIHVGVKPFQCPYENCESVFARQDNMRQHYRTHYKNTSVSPPPIPIVRRKRIIDPRFIVGGATEDPPTLSSRGRRSSTASRRRTQSKRSTSCKSTIRSTPSADIIDDFLGCDQANPDNHASKGARRVKGKAADPSFFSDSDSDDDSTTSSSSSTSSDSEMDINLPSDDDEYRPGRRAATRRQPRRS
ncbi:hypothetical protein HDV00_009689 [Rhizophlyctis rosea]|nr:hypothetical protein HDV00_009689 [Rhizophlyctis rosea]